MIVRCKAKGCRFYDGGCSLTMIDLDEQGGCSRADFEETDWWSELDGVGDLEEQLNELMKEGGAR